MFIRSQRFPISDGVITAALRSGLETTWGTGLTVSRQLPAVKTRRMVTVRDDSGTATGRTQPRRQGVNVWADDPVDAINIALDAMHICQTDLPTGSIVSATSEFSGPYEIDEDVPFVVGQKNLTHYYFIFTATVKAAAA
jgi:hypothetical protein